MLRPTLLHGTRILVMVAILMGWPGTPVAANPLRLTRFAQATRTGYVPGQLIVKFTPDVANLIKAQLGTQPRGKPNFRQTPSLDQLSRDFGLINVVPVFNLMSRAATPPSSLSQIYLLTVPPSTDIWQMAADFSANPEVVYAEPNYIVGQPDLIEASADQPLDLPQIPANFPNDPAFGKQYALSNTGQNGGTAGADVAALAAWQIQTGDPSVMIAVLDTGVNYNHRDLAGKVRRDLDIDFVSLDDDAFDTADHGTRVAGVAAALTNNGTGISGMCWGCQILPVRVGTMVIHFTNLSVAQGIVYATLVKADVINMSLGGQCSNLWADAVNFAYDQDVVLVAAAGNVVEFVAYPALFNRVIAVSATDRHDRLASFSSFGPAVDLAAPGASMRVTAANGQIDTGSGTSYAAALTSGIVGLLRSENPALTNAQVQQILQESAEDLGAPGVDPLFGYGRVNARRALALAFTPPPAPPRPAPDVCGCLLSQALADLTPLKASPAAAAQTSKLDLVYRLRDEILRPTPLGRRITADYYRHSPQVVSLLLRDATLRDQLQHLFDAGLPYLISLLEEVGKKRLETGIIDQANTFIQALAGQANPELQAELLQTWQALNLKSYTGQPVKAALQALVQSPRQAIYLPMITKSY